MRHLRLNIRMFWLILIPVVFACNEWSPWKENPQHIADTFEEVLEEVAVKKTRLIRLMDEKRLDGILLSKVQNVSWMTGGICRSRYSLLNEVGSVSLLILRSGGPFLITADHHARRLMEEGMTDLGYTAKPFPWMDREEAFTIPGDFLNTVVPGRRIGTDHRMLGLPFIGDDMRPLQASLTKWEIERYRWLGKQVAEALSDVAHRIQPGMNEFEIESMLATSLYSRSIQPAVLMVAVDERLFSYPSAFPGEAKLKKYALLSVAGEKWGLIASLTRHVHLGPVSDDLKAKHWATAKILSTLQQSIRPGQAVSGLFEDYRRAYSDAGFENAWSWSPPGGASGYEYPQAFTPLVSERIVNRQAFALHPSILGTGCGDTFIVYADSVEVVTSIKDWPVLSMEIDGKTWFQPNVLVR